MQLSNQTLVPQVVRSVHPDTNIQRPIFQTTNINFIGFLQRKIIVHEPRK